MKFHNQKSFMGREISNVTNKPLLHKKGKQWIVVAVSALILAGFGGMVSTTTHADTTQLASATKVAQPSQNNGNSSKVAITSNSTKNNSAVTPSNNKPVVHMLGGSNPATLAPNDELAPKDQNVHETANGMWGSAYWNFYSNNQLDIHDGTLDRLTTPQLNSIESKITSIKTYNDIAPSDMSGMFGAGMGNHSDHPGNMPASDNQFTALQDIDLSGLNTSNVTNMDGLFHGASSLQHITFGHTFDTSKVSDFSGMFVDDTQIQYLDLSSFNTKNATNLSYLFNNTPSLRVVDLSNFVASNPNVFQGNGNTFTFASNGYSNGGWGHHFNNSLHQLIIGNGLNGINLQNLGLTTGGVGNSVPLKNTTKNSDLPNSWNSVNGVGNYIDTGDKQNYTVNFYDESNNNNLVGTSSYTGVTNAPFLPIDGIPLPSGYQLAPNAGTTANVINGNTAAINVVPTGTVATGTWGSANWLLYSNGKLLLLDGALETPQVPNELNNDLYNKESGVTSIVTNKVIAPRNSDNLFSKFTQASPIDLTGMDFSSVPASNISNMFHNNTVEVHFNNTIDGDLYEDMANTSSMASTTNTQAQSNSGWIHANSANLSSASTNAQDADKWVHSNSNSAQSADSWVAKNSQNESNASTEANDANNWISSNSASLSSASASASTNSAWISKNGVPASTSANNAESWINSNSGRLSNASTAATEAMTSLNNDSAELKWLATNETSLSNNASQTTSNQNWIKTNSASVSALSQNFTTVYNKIQQDSTALSNAINTKADSASVNNDEDVLAGTLTHDINDLDTLDEQANSLANADEKWINTNKANISNNSANASSSIASLSGSTNSANVSASKGISSNAANISNNTTHISNNSNTAASGISNDNASASASASVVNANADSYALSLANNATDIANVNAGGIDNTIDDNDQTVQSLSNTVNANTESLADNDNDLYATKENKSANKHNNIKKVNGNLFYFYVIKPMWLHTSAKFTKGNRVKALTAKHGYTLPITRIFKVNGAVRFEVKINGTKYFVTGRKDFARNAYIQPNEIKRNSSIKVLRNIREYKRAGFGKKNFIRNFKRGSVLPIKRAKTIAGKQVTRLQLTNGHWITANKNLVKLI